MPSRFAGPARLAGPGPAGLAPAEADPLGLAEAAWPLLLLLLSLLFLTFSLHFFSRSSFINSPYLAEHV